MFDVDEGKFVEHFQGPTLRLVRLTPKLWPILWANRDLLVSHFPSMGGPSINSQGRSFIGNALGMIARAIEGFNRIYGQVASPNLLIDKHTLTTSSSLGRRTTHPCRKAWGNY